MTRTKFDSLMAIACNTYTLTGISVFCPKITRPFLNLKQVSEPLFNEPSKVILWLKLVETRNWYLGKKVFLNYTKS